MAPKPKPLSFIVDAGCGRVPTALARKAMKSCAPNASPLMKRRRFIGIDEAININKLVRRTGLNTSPGNMELVESCAVQTLTRLKPESTKIIFESFLLNNLTDNSCITGQKIPCNTMFLASAKRALKPGGRLIMIHIKAGKKLYQGAAKSLGMGFHAIEISDAVAKESGLRSVKLKSSPEKRLMQMRRWKKKGAVTKKELKAMLKSGEIKSEDDYARPTVFILRKPRKGEKMEVGELGKLSENLDSAIMTVPNALLELIRQLIR